MKRISTALIACALGCAVHGPATEAATETVLYSFCSQQNCADGANPLADLIDVNGTLYGTTVSGGSGTCDGGCGTVFSLNPMTGTETVLYSFQNNGTDGADPVAGLINVNGTLYGTTADGGAYCWSNCGTVFSIDLNTGVETVLHSFGNGADGANPLADLIDVNGLLYGPTEQGGTGNGAAGTLFSLDPDTGAYAVVYSFCSQSGCTDGQYPNGLIGVNGTLYGTTDSGGRHDSGTVFAFNPQTEAETVLHSFCTHEKCPDGRYPGGSLIDVNGTLYGTTYWGGTGSCYGGSGCGTVFSLNPSTGVETVLHSFAGGLDGRDPDAGLIDVAGVLYGTTVEGGGHGCSGIDSSGCGTVFGVFPKTSAETVVYSFCSKSPLCTDGARPQASLIDVNGTLYGTTDTGGAGNCEGGCGTVFSITPGSSGTR